MSQIFKELQVKDFKNKTRFTIELSAKRTYLLIRYYSMVLYYSRNKLTIIEHLTLFPACFN